MKLLRILSAPAAAAPHVIPFSASQLHISAQQLEELKEKAITVITASLSFTLCSSNFDDLKEYEASIASTGTTHKGTLKRLRLSSVSKSKRDKKGSKNEEKEKEKEKEINTGISIFFYIYFQSPSSRSHVN